MALSATAACGTICSEYRSPKYLEPAMMNLYDEPTTIPAQMRPETDSCFSVIQELGSLEWTGHLNLAA